MNGNALVELVRSFVDPATTAIMILIPSVCVCYCGVVGLKSYTITDEQEKQAYNVKKKIKDAVILAVVLFSLTTILKIFGIG